MRRRPSTSSYGYEYDKPHFEYYTNDVETDQRHCNQTASTKSKGFKYDGSTEIPKVNESFSLSSSAKNRSSAPLASNTTPWSSETLTSQEIKHYKKALKEIYDTVNLRMQRFETDSDISDEFTQSDTDKQSLQIASSSPVTEIIAEKPCYKVTKNEMKKPRLINPQEIYRELHVISQKLKDETRELQAWEDDLRERECMLKDAEDIAAAREELVSETLEEELDKRCTLLDAEYQDHLGELQKALHEKTKEANRVRDSFNTIRSAHEDLRKQFLDIQDQNRVLESQTLSLQQRLNNLLRKNELQNKQREGTKSFKTDENPSLNVKHNNIDGKKPMQAKFNLSGILDVLANLLIWVSDGQLDYTTAPQLEEQQTNQTLSRERVHGKCVKILPPLADLLSYLPAVNPDVMYPLLKFVYSVILYMEQIPQGTQKPVLNSTLRRIGEELYKPQVVKQPESFSLDVKKGKHVTNIYLRSSNLEERMLSTLIILKTISRADCLSHVFDVLKLDLREEEGKRLFIVHNGVDAIIPLMKTRNKSILECAVDVILQMSMESGVVSEFLMRCSTGDFFNACTNLLQDKGLEPKILEKLSIVLQRLSKIRSNRRYFEAFQLVPLMQELLRQHDSDNAFLSLNLRSMLVNLNVAKTA